MGCRVEGSQSQHSSADASLKLADWPVGRWADHKPNFLPAQNLAWFFHLNQIRIFKIRDHNGLAELRAGCDDAHRNTVGRGHAYCVTFFVADWAEHQNSLNANRKICHCRNCWPTHLTLCTSSRTISVFYSTRFYFSFSPSFWELYT